MIMAQAGIGIFPSNLLSKFSYNNDIVDGLLPAKNSIY